MAILSYVVARDYGFAPNPFYKICTLGTCKPVIRRTANIGDWIVGVGSASYKLRGHFVFVMKVSEILTYDQYWNDARFNAKKPNLRGSVKQWYGDNIYHRDPKTKKWIQENSHHSNPDGTPNSGNIKHDTQCENVLVGSEFTYWGGMGPKIPARLRNFKGHDLCPPRGHKRNFPSAMVEFFEAWYQAYGEIEYVNDPAEFTAKPAKRRTRKQ